MLQNLPRNGQFLFLITPLQVLLSPLDGKGLLVPFQDCTELSSATYLFAFVTGLIRGLDASCRTTCTCCRPLLQVLSTPLEA